MTWGRGEGGIQNGPKDNDVVNEQPLINRFKCHYQIKCNNDLNGLWDFFILPRLTFKQKVLPGTWPVFVRWWCREG